MPSPDAEVLSISIETSKINWNIHTSKYDINRHINPKEVVDDLLENKIVGSK